ncbi:MAG: SIMPL domain-containing protein [Vulcanimicrobiaceae bacterium]
MAALLACVPAQAATSAGTVTVSGSGTISRDPDRALLSVSIVTNNDVAATATSANNRLYNALVDRMRGVGVPAAAIKTSSYDLNFVPKPPPGDNYKPPQTGFIVTRALSITIDNLSNVGGVIDAAVAAGVTQVNGVSFGLRDDRGAHAAALAAAVEDAATQAAAIAQAAHMHLGAIRRVSSVQSPVFAPQMMRVATLAAAPAVPTQISPSSVEIHATVTVTYELAP